MYEIKNQLNDWKQQQTEADEAAADAKADSKRVAPADGAGSQTKPQKQENTK